MSEKQSGVGNSSARSRDSKQGSEKSTRSAIAAACRYCRQRKKRCDGQRPSCGECLKSNVECDYEAVAVNETRHRAAKRHTAALQVQLDEVATSLARLKEMPHSDAILWLSALRSAREPLAVLRSVGNAGALPPASVSELSTVRGMMHPDCTDLDIALGVKHPTVYPLLPIESVHMGDVIPQGFPSRTDISKQEYTPVGAAEPMPQLCDDRLWALDISYWSPVPIPNDLAARLLSLYLVTDHPLHSPFDADLFIEDLTHCALRFCSPLLVNSLLFWACQTYGAIEQSAIPFASRFQAVALRLLTALEDTDSIMNVASLFCLTVGSICSGEEAAAIKHLSSFLHMSVTLRLHGHNSGGLTELGLYTPDWLSAYSYVAWSSYNFCCIYVSHYRGKDWMSFVSRPPLLPVPGSDVGQSLRPILKPPPMFMGETFTQYCILLPINRGILSAYLDDESPPTQIVSLAFAEERYQRLLEWADQLPATHALSGDMPHHAAILHMSFHAIVMELFRPFLGRRLTLSQSPHPGATPEEVFTSSSRRMVEVFRFYYNKFHGTTFAHTITWLIAPIYTAHISIKGHDDTAEQRRHDFRLCANALMGLGISSAMKEAIVRGIMGMAVLSGLFSPHESRQVMAKVFEGRARQQSIETNLLIDFDRAMENWSGSTVEAFARQYEPVDESNG